MTGNRREPAPIARRSLLAGAAGLAPMTALSAPSHPDAAVLAACAAFDELEMAYIASFNGELDDTPEGVAAVEERERIHDAQRLVLDRICGQPATTLAGVRAKARSLVLWDEEAIEDDATYFNDRLRTSLLRDLLAVQAEAPQR